MNAKTTTLVVGILAVTTLLVWNLARRKIPPSARLADPVSTLAYSTQQVTQPPQPSPWPRNVMPPSEIVPAKAPSKNILSKYKRNEDLPSLTLDQVQAYLKDNHRNAESLLAAFNATRNHSLLQEAEEKFPGDPRVDFTAATQSESPEERRKWIDAFKASDPDNAIANYLSASDFFKSGKTEQALQEVQAAAAKSVQDYRLDNLLNTAEAYRAAGYSEADAKTIASINLLLPDLGACKTIGYSLVDLANTYRQAGDMESAQASLKMALDLGERINVSGPLTMIQTMVGLAIEQKALGAMDPNAAPGAGNQTLQSRLDAINQQRDALKSLNQQWITLLPQLPDEDVANFFQREWQFGEQAAEQWLVAKHTSSPGQQ